MTETLKGAVYDGLLGGTVGTLLRMVKVDGDTALARGMLLAGSFDGSEVTVHLATAADTVPTAELFIAAEDAVEATAVSAYECGQFNRNAIVVSDETPVTAFEGSLRRQGIYLTEAI